MRAKTEVRTVIVKFLMRKRFNFRNHPLRSAAATANITQNKMRARKFEDKCKRLQHTPEKAAVPTRIVEFCETLAQHHRPHLKRGQKRRESSFWSHSTKERMYISVFFNVIMESMCRAENTAAFAPKCGACVTHLH
jgi:hypothetical protein